MFKLVISTKDVPPGEWLCTDETGAAWCPKGSFQSSTRVSHPVQPPPSSTLLSEAAMNKVRDDVSGGVRLFRYNECKARDTINSRVLCILAVPSSVDDDSFWSFVETTCTVLSTCPERSSGIVSIRLIHDPSWTQGRSMVVLQFATQDATESFFMGHNNRRFTYSAPEECQIVYLASVVFVPPHCSSSSSSSASCYKDFTPIDGSSLIELPTCPVCMDRLDPDVSGLLCTPCNRSFYMDTRTEWIDNVCPVCSCIASHAQKGVNIKCHECGTTKDLWVCLVCGHTGCGRGSGSHALEHFSASKHTFCYDLEKKRIWDYTSDKYVHKIPFQDDDDSCVSNSNSSSVRGRVPAEVPENSKVIDAEVSLSRMFDRQKHLLEGEMRKTKQGLDKEREAEEARVRELEALVRDAEAALEEESRECERLERLLEANAKKRAAADNTIKGLRDRVTNMKKAEAEAQKVVGDLTKDRDSEERRYAQRESELREECAKLVEVRDDLRQSILEMNKHFEMQSVAASNPSAQNGDIITLAPNPSSKKKRNIKRHKK